MVEVVDLREVMPLSVCKKKHIYDSQLYNSEFNTILGFFFFFFFVEKQLLHEAWLVIWGGFVDF